jgi:O-antigen/teichoic acid export membrane protein
MPIVAPSPPRSTTGRLQAIVPSGEGYVALVRNLMKSSGIYALASFAGPLISLVLAPFLTHNLTPSEFGALAILNTLIGLVAGVSQLGLGSAFFRAYNYDYTDARDRRAIPFTVTALLLLLTIPTVIGVIVAAPLVSQALLGSPDFATPIIVAALVILMQNLSVPGFAWLRADNRAAFFAALSIANLVISLSANLVLVGALRLGVIGSLLATGSGYTTVVICTLPIIVLRSRLRVRLDIAWSVVSFGAPQVLSLISVWVLALSDRYLLGVIASLSEAAHYSVAYSLGSVVSTAIIAPFALAWPTTMYAIAKRHDAARLFRLVFRWFSLLLLFAAFLLSIVSTALLYWLFPASYRSAAPIIPVVSASIACYGLYIVFMTGASIRRKTWVAAALTGVAAAVNFGLNLLLIPRFHAMGAAASTFLAYALLGGLAFLINRAIYPVPYELARFLNAALMGVALFTWCMLLDSLVGDSWSLVIGASGVIVYALWLLYLSGGARLLRRGLPMRQ